MFNIGIIGLGNIGSALYKGMIKAKFEKKLIYACDKSLRHSLVPGFKKQQLMDKPREIIENCDLIFLCVRSDQVCGFLKKYSKIFTPDHKIIAMSAGVSLSDIKMSLSNSSLVHLVRVVANVNLSSCNSYTIVFKDKNIDISVFEEVVSIFNRLGVVKQVHSEEKLDIFSLLTGCGPALLAQFLEAIVDSGIEIGIKNHEASEIVKQITASTISTLELEKINSHEFMRRASTPGGLVAKALDDLSKTEFKSVVNNWLPNIYNMIKSKKE